MKLFQFPHSHYSAKATIALLENLYLGPQLSMLYFALSDGRANDPAFAATEVKKAQAALAG